MQGPGPSFRTHTAAGPEKGPVYCFTGTVNLAEAAPKVEPGTIIGQLVTGVGVGVPLVQSAQLFSPTSLNNVNQQNATACGTFVLLNGQLALDVSFVAPGVNALTPGVSPLALTVLALLGLLPVAG